MYTLCILNNVFDRKDKKKQGRNYEISNVEAV